MAVRTGYSPLLVWKALPKCNADHPLGEGEQAMRQQSSSVDFTSKVTAMDVQLGAAGSLIVVANVEGSAEAFGPFIDTLCISPAGHPSGTWDYHAYALPTSDTTPSGPCKAYPSQFARLARPYMPGAVLTGDAAGFTDLILGQGLSVTLRNALLASDD